jgi:hypothetical protein
MTDGTGFQPGEDEVTVPFRSRGAYTGYRAFGGGDGAVLIAPSVVHGLRSAAELATAERRIAGGLLYGRGWADEMGTYLVIDHYLEAGPGENSGDRISADGDDDFTLSEGDLRLLRQDAARMYSASLEAGWWRTRAALGEFGPEDFETQGELVGPDGVGLLVYGSGIYWGTAYLGPVGLAPDSAGTLAAVPDLGPAPGPPPWPGPGAEAGIAPAVGITSDPDLVDIAAGESLQQEPALPGTAPPRRQVRRRRAVSVRGTARGRRGARLAEWGGPGPGPELPADVQFVVGALMAVTVAAAILIGFIVSSLLVAVIIGAVGLLVIVSSVWMSRR